MVRLAELAAPACRIEPQLLRQLRLVCVPEADVSVEQELWHSELVNERGRDHHPPRRRRPACCASACGQLARPCPMRSSTAPGHHDQAARRAVAAAGPRGASLPGPRSSDDTGTIATGARTLLDSLLSRRDGLDNWLGRAWSGLPADLKRRPEGRALGAGGRGQGRASGRRRPTPADADTVAHLLPLDAHPVDASTACASTVNVRPSEATHVHRRAADAATSACRSRATPAPRSWSSARARRRPCTWRPARSSSGP